MTVSSTTRKAGPFQGNGVTTAFPFAFKVFTASDITLTRTDAGGSTATLTLNSEYSVTLNADQDNNPGGTITYPRSGTPLAVGETLTGIGSVAASQGTDITNLGRFLPQVIEDAFDKLTILAQQLLEKMDRALVAPVSDSTPPGALPAKAALVGKYLAFDTSGNPTASSGTGADAGLRTDLAAATGASLAGFKLGYAGAALQDLQTVLRNTGGVSVTQFMLPADIADIALAVPLRNQAVNIKAAIDSGNKKILFPTGNYRVDSVIRLVDGVQLIGASSAQSKGTSIRFSKTDGTHCFDSDPALFLSGVLVQDMEIVNTANAAGTVGTGDAFHVFALTNNCCFRNVLVRNFGGSAWAVGPQTTTLTDKTALQNVRFDQCFVVSCGGYAFDVSGFVNAVWTMCDLNSCATGFFRFADGTTNQTMIDILGLWIEGTQAWTALTVFDMQDTKGQMLNLVGCDFTNSRAGTSRVVKSTTTSCRINSVGSTGFGWTTGHEDTPTGNSTPLANPWNYFYQLDARSITVRGAGPVLDVFQDVGGTPDQRRFRAGVSGNDLLFSARADDGSSVRNLFKFNHATGAFVPGVDITYDFGGVTTRWANGYISTLRPGAGGVKWTSGAGTPEGVLTAPVGSLYTRTDGGAGTTLYAKESGSGNTGWVGK